MAQTLVINEGEIFPNLFRNASIELCMFEEDMAVEEATHENRIHGVEFGKNFNGYCNRCTFVPLARRLN